MIKHSALLVVAFVFCNVHICSAMTAQEIVAKMERDMFPDAKCKVLLTFERRGKLEETYRFSITTKDRNSKVLARFSTPASMVGNDILMVDKNVWAYRKEAGRIVKIPSNLAFGSTDFCYGDVVRLNLGENYTAKLVSDSGLVTVLELQAKERTAPYFRIVLKLDSKTYLPKEGLCYGRNGTLIKRMEYYNVKQINGKSKPVSIKVVSPKDASWVSIMTIENEEPKGIPDRLFNKYNLGTNIDDNL